MTWWQIALIAYIVLMGFVALFFWRAYLLNAHYDRLKDVARHGWSPWCWSQDGYVRKCKLCKAVQYGGDDFDGGPDASGNVEA